MSKNLIKINPKLFGEKSTTEEAFEFFKESSMDSKSLPHEYQAGANSFLSDKSANFEKKFIEDYEAKKEYIDDPWKGGYILKRKGELWDFLKEEMVEGFAKFCCEMGNLINGPNSPKKPYTVMQKQPS